MWKISKKSRRGKNFVTVLSWPKIKPAESWDIATFLTVVVYSDVCHHGFITLCQADTLSHIICRRFAVQVPVSKFHDLRYNVASILKEMNDLEKRSILKIQD